MYFISYLLYVFSIQISFNLENVYNKWKNFQ